MLTAQAAAIRGDVDTHRREEADPQKETLPSLKKNLERPGNPGRDLSLVYRTLGVEESEAGKPLSFSFNRQVGVTVEESPPSLEENLERAGNPGRDFSLVYQTLGVRESEAQKPLSFSFNRQVGVTVTVEGNFDPYSCIELRSTVLNRDKTWTQKYFVVKEGEDRSIPDQLFTETLQKGSVAMELQAFQREDPTTRSKIGDRKILDLSNGKGGAVLVTFKKAEEGWSVAFS